MQVRTHQAQSGSRQAFSSQLSPSTAVVGFDGALLGASLRVPHAKKHALRRTRLIYFSKTFLIWPTFFWILPASFSLWPSAAMLGLFVIRSEEHTSELQSHSFI